MNTIDEKTFKQGVDEFIGCAPEGGWSDYWAMQQDWEFYKDSLCRDGVITQKQADSWSNPCTPDTFARWQKRNGLVRRGYESKKSEGIGDRIKMGIDYNMFMRMCGSAAYLDDNEDYWDALWEYYSEMGEIEDALVFFDNLFQYTAWCDVDELYGEYLDDAYKDKSKSKETCIQEAVDGGDLDAYKHSSGKYLVIL